MLESLVRFLDTAKFDVNFFFSFATGSVGSLAEQHPNEMTRAVNGFRFRFNSKFCLFSLLIKDTVDPNVKLR